jgi:hypothetical protein
VAKRVPAKDHKTLISLQSTEKGFIYSMTIDYDSNTFCVTRSNRLNHLSRISSKDLDFNIFTKDGKALIKRYADFAFKDGDLEEFDALLVELFNTYVSSTPTAKI